MLILFQKLLIGHGHYKLIRRDILAVNTLGIFYNYICTYIITTYKLVNYYLIANLVDSEDELISSRKSNVLKNGYTYLTRYVTV